MPELRCETCRQDMLFEVPPCVDGHGDDCPELVCTGCGTALLRTMLAPTLTPQARTPQARPPRQRIISEGVPRQASRRPRVGGGATHGEFVRARSS